MRIAEGIRIPEGAGACVKEGIGKRVAEVACIGTGVSPDLTVRPWPTMCAAACGRGKRVAIEEEPTLTADIRSRQREQRRLDELSEHEIPVPSTKRVIDNRMQAFLLLTI